MYQEVTSYETSAMNIGRRIIKVGAPGGAGAFGWGTAL
jgi:hypothetical protein